MKERPWAELCVLRGAPAQRLMFCANAPAHHRIGSGERASLRLLAADVAPHHLELLWDGEDAWLEDPLRLGRTLVNGRPLNEWLRVPHVAMIVLGSVRLGMRAEPAHDVAVSKQSERRVPNFEALERAHLLQTGTIRRRDTLRLGAIKTGNER